MGKCLSVRFFRLRVTMLDNAVNEKATQMSGSLSRCHALGLEAVEAVRAVLPCWEIDAVVFNELP